MHILNLKVWQLLHDAFGVEATRKEFEHIDDSDPHPTDARPAATARG